MNDRQWDRARPEQLATMAQPNDVGVLLHWIAPETGATAPSTGGSRLDRVKAVYEAMRRANLRYVPERAEYGATTTQLIRTASEVLNDRRGTCLDLAMTFAGSLRSAVFACSLALATS